MTGETLNNVQCLSVLVVVLISISSYTLTTVHSQDISVECGTINIAKELIIEGNQTLKGFWPFSVAIVEVQEHRPFCGGTLISRKHVLTGMMINPIIATLPIQDQFKLQLPIASMTNIILLILS